MHPGTGPQGQVWAPEGRHEIALMCDDLRATMEDLSGRGAHFDGEPEDMDFGLAVHLRVPAAANVLLYEPRHPTAYDL